MDFEGFWFRVSENEGIERCKVWQLRVIMAFGLLGGFWGPLRVHIAYIVGIYEDPRVKAPY